MSTRFPQSYIYLASPYSHKDDNVTYDRYTKTETVMAHYTRAGKVIFSPILHNHHLALVHDMPTDIAFWWKFNRTMLAQASELWLLTLDGWQASKGMRKESLFAIQHEIPISHIHYAAVLEK